MARQSCIVRRAKTRPVMSIPSPSIATAATHSISTTTIIPCLGAILGFIAFIWGLAIYVKATAVANELSLGRALLAAILPAAVLIGLVSLVVIPLILLIVIAAVA